MSEELLELRGQTEQLRHENTNLRSEREVGKVSIEMTSLVHVLD